MNFVSVNEVILASSVLIGVLLIFALIKKEQSEGLKLLLFWGMVIPIVATTLYLTGVTIARNLESVTGGPVHWHADYEIFVCGEDGAREMVKGQSTLLAHEDEPIDLQDPGGISNRIGTPDFHEHGDNRIHVEGTVRKLEDVSLGKFFESVGGALEKTYMRLPTNQGEFIVQNGMSCPGGEQGLLQVFLYQTRGQEVSQEKLARFPDYVISPHGNVPPGDCLIIEFGPVKEKTEKLCKFYDIALQKGGLHLK